MKTRETRRSREPDFAKATSGRLAIPPRGKPRGILAKASGTIYDPVTNRDSSMPMTKRTR